MFFIQQLTMLVEAVYRYNLLDTSFGPGTAGLICFLSPLYLFFDTKDPEHQAYRFLWIVLFLQVLVPWLPNPWRIAGAGCAVALFLIALIPLLNGAFGGNPLQIAAGALLADLLSVSLRTFGSTMDVSLSGDTVLIGWLLIIVAAYYLYRLSAGRNLQTRQTGVDRRKTTAVLYVSMIGIFSVIAFIYFILSSPGVVSRWTGSDYSAIHICFAVAAAVFILIYTCTDWLQRIKRWQILLWNLIFALMLLVSISLHMIDPPSSPSAAPLAQYPSVIWDNLTVYCLFALSPVLFLDLAVFTERLTGRPTASLAGPSLMGALLLVGIILIIILTNVWGYAGLIGRMFRQRFYLPFFVLSLGIHIPLWYIKSPLPFTADRTIGNRYLLMSGIGFCCLIIIGVFSIVPNPPAPPAAGKPLTVMTYNLQQGTDCSGNRSYADQLAVIRKINPDILCLQESDGARISGGNTDIVRYLSDRLDYYSYYGPNTISGTFGTAILSRSPLYNCRSIFTYSDKDEIGTAVCTVKIQGKPVLLVNCHPDGSAAAKKAHLDMLLRLVRKNKQIMALGDFNFEPDSPFYARVSAELTDSWQQSDFPGITKRIDYIFLAEDFKVIKRYYIPSPASASDHPAYAADIKMEVH